MVVPVVIIALGQFATDSPNARSRRTADDSPFQSASKHRTQHSATGTADECCFARPDAAPVIVVVPTFIIGSITAVIALANRLIHSAVIIAVIILLRRAPVLVLPAAPIFFLTTALVVVRPLRDDRRYGGQEQGSGQEPSLYQLTHCSPLRTSQVETRAAG
jgi:hypothetical protein